MAPLNQKFSIIRMGRVLNILTNGWRLLTLKAGPNMFFHIFCMFLQVFDAKVMKIRGKMV